MRLTPNSSSKDSRIQFRSLNAYVLFKNMVLRIICFFIASYALYHFKENPLVTVIVAVFFLFGFLIVGNRELILYSNRIEFTTDSILLRYRKRVFYLSEIIRFKPSGNFGFKTDFVTDVSPIPLNEPWNFVDISLKSGASVRIPTHIYIGALKTAEEIISKQIELVDESR